MYFHRHGPGCWLSARHLLALAGFGTRNWMNPSGPRRAAWMEALGLRTEVWLASKHPVSRQDHINVFVPEAADLRGGKSRIGGR